MWHYEGVRQADDLFVCFGAKTNKGLSSRSSTWPEADNGTPVRRVGKTTSGVSRGTQRRQLVKGDAEAWSTTVSSEEDSQDESAFLVALWKFREGSTSALVYRCTGNAVSRNHPSCTMSWPKPLLFVCSLFFFSRPLSCISCGHKEMCDTPVGTTRWITGQDRIVSKKLINTRGRGGIVTARPEF